MVSQIIYRELSTMEEFEQVFQLEIDVWQMEPAEAVSIYTLNAVTHNGGVLIGAEAEGKIIGFAFGIPARKGDKWWLWSHVTGVSRLYQRRGVGFKLKQMQRNWALENGYDMIRWTFDPMKRTNANFNMHRLGTVSQKYLVNHYGDMNDGLNQGMKSDRLEVVWHLKDSRVAAIARGLPVSPLLQTYPPDAFLLWQDGKRIAESLELHAEWHFVEIPYDLDQLKQTEIERAQVWQLSLRRVIRAAIAQSYVLVDFIDDGSRCWYVLQRQYPGPTVTQTLRRAEF